MKFEISLFTGEFPKPTITASVPICRDRRFTILHKRQFSAPPPRPRIRDHLDEPEFK